ncbi:hypothetical protein [Geomicrobium sediminis]|uniref:Ca2+/Na+ antiporter n=1 Tax=Geomicrobium sediminis TaxID=1347788 RepID=A0ABS2PA83_9BACL|nr:hypothetical protein [Geomicrobium sediminis]MBM7632295.1 Ca2+/Na+ antiporter [Geomicrobium sediminis]
MNVDLSYEELRRISKKRTFLTIPLSTIIVVAIGYFLIYFQLPPFRYLLFFFVFTYIGTTLGWMFRSEERNVELERRWIEKKARKTRKRKIIEFILIWSVIIIVLRLFIYIFG